VLRFGGSVSSTAYASRTGSGAVLLRSDASHGADQQQGDTIPNPGNAPERDPTPEATRVLRAKYLDWCSAQVADHFVALSPEEIFELAERAAGEGPSVPGRSLSSSGAAGDLSDLRSLVELLTGVLADQLELPDFEAWLEFYERNPAAVEERLIGFWKEP
jgi:hypothetical protein